MRKEYRCSRCGALLAVLKEGELKVLQILCTHRGKKTNNEKCNTINEIPLVKK